MPKKIGAGNKPQEYSEANGEYNADKSFAGSRLRKGSENKNPNFNEKRYGKFFDESGRFKGDWEGYGKAQDDEFVESQIKLIGEKYGGDVERGWDEVLRNSGEYENEKGLSWDEVAEIRRRIADGAKIEGGLGKDFEKGVKKGFGFEQPAIWSKTPEEKKRIEAKVHDYAASLADEVAWGEKDYSYALREVYRKAEESGFDEVGKRNAKNVLDDAIEDSKKNVIRDEDNNDEYIKTYEYESRTRNLEDSGQRRLLNEKIAKLRKHLLDGYESNAKDEDDKTSDYRRASTEKRNIESLLKAWGK